MVFSSVHLDVPPAQGWRGGLCRLLRADGGRIEIICAALSSLSAAGQPFEVTVTGGPGERHGPFQVEGVVAGFPPGADCFLFRREAGGLWEGVTVTAAHRRLAVIPYACDPA